ncbi:MAG: hypothetical protein AAF694_11960 [Bacteroidota bacterium]
MKAIHVQKPISTFSILFIGIFALTLFTSCEEDNTIDPSTPMSFEEGIEFSLDEADIEGTFEEVEEIALGVEEEAILGPDRRVAAPPIILWRCATIDRDTINQVITVDFGDGCEGRDGRIRKGKIVITYNDKVRLHIPGATRTTEFVDFSVDDVTVEGTRTLTNLMDAPEDFISFQSSLTGGKITWPDGSTATREFTRTRTWLRGSNPRQDEFQKTGSASGTTREGVSYSIEITSPLTYKRNCRTSRVFIAVAGSKTLTRSGSEEVLVEYGSGECDSIITLTVGEETREVDVREELRKRARRQ